MPLIGASELLLLLVLGSLFVCPLLGLVVFVLVRGQQKKPEE